MSIRNSVKALSAVIAGLDLQLLEEDEAKRLDKVAPPGYKPYLTSVQPNGRTIVSEIVLPDNDTDDELRLRYDNGNAYANQLQIGAAHAAEEVSRHEMNMRDVAKSIRDNYFAKAT